MPPKPIARRTLARQPPPPGLYASSYTPERGAAICRRIAAGESIRSMCRHDPTMPTEKTVWNWAQSHREFEVMKVHAQDLARGRSLAAQAERDAARRAAPSKRRAWNKGVSGYGPGMVDAICDRLLEGQALTAICREPGAPSVGTVYNWLRAHPEFVAEYRKAKAFGCVELVDRLCAHAPGPGDRGWWTLLRRTMKAADRQASRLTLDRYAPAMSAPELTVQLEDAAGVLRTLYQARRG